MFERFNQGARRALFVARYEASRHGSLSIETEHLLLGLIQEPPGVMSLVFARTRVPLELIRQEIESRTNLRQKVAISVDIPFSAETKRVIQHAVIEADRLGHNNIGAEHLLLGILNEEGCIAASVLTAKGMRLDTGREGVVQARNEQPDADAPS